MRLWGVGNGNKLLEIKYHHFSSSFQTFRLTYELIPQSVSVLQLRSGDNEAIDEGQENSSAMMANINNLSQSENDENVGTNQMGIFIRKCWVNIISLWVSRNAVECHQQ